MRTEIIAVIDRSGSMRPIEKDVIGGFNTFLDAQQKLPGEAKLTMVLFDHERLTPYAGVPIKDVKPLDSTTYIPRGGTALLDAIGYTMEEQGARIAADKWAETVVLMIQTDGQENQSTKYKNADIKRMIEHAEKSGWDVVYLGANQDAFDVASSMGFQGKNVSNFAANAVGARAAYATMSATVSSKRMTGATMDISNSAANQTVTGATPSA